MTFALLESLIIADASPLIGLAKIGRLGLLRELAREANDGGGQRVEAGER